MRIKEVDHWFDGMTIEQQAGLYYHYWTKLAEDYKKLEEKYNLLYDLRCKEVEINDSAKEIQIDVAKLMNDRDKDLYREKLSDIKNYLKQLKHYQFEYDLGLGLNKINGCEEDFVKDILEIIGDI